LSSDVSLVRSQDEDHVEDDVDRVSEHSGESEEHNIYGPSSPTDSTPSPSRKFRLSPNLTLPKARVEEKTENFGELFVLRTLMEHYNGGESYNGVLVLPLRKFRQLCKDCGYMDDRTGEKFGKQLSAGNVAVAYQTAVSHTQPAFGLNGLHKGAVTTLGRIEELLWKPTKKFRRREETEEPSPRNISKKKEFLQKKLHGGGGATHSDRIMVPCQFRAALVDLSVMFYNSMITKIFGRSIVNLNDAERRAAEEAAFEVFYRKFLLSFTLKNCSIDSSAELFDNVTDLLCHPNVKDMYMNEISALTALHDWYAESERAKKAWDTAHGKAGSAGVSLRANLKLLTYREFVRFLTDFGGIPYFINSAQVFHIFRHVTRRCLMRKKEKPKFQLKKDRKGRKWRQVELAGLEHNQADDYEEVERPDFLNFSQFCECLGHFAVAAFTHETTEERLMTLWKWFDQSDGHQEIGKHKSSSGVRFAIRSGYS